MPSFGVPSSMPPGSSSLSSCVSTLASSSTTADPGISSAPVPDGCMSHLFGAPHLPPPPPLSLSDAAPYSPPPAYPPVFPFGPPLLPSARFPPPPNPSFARPVSNITFFEGPQAHYPPEPHAAYDHWSDGSINSNPYGGGGDHFSKSFSHWSLPTFNSGMNGNNSNSNNNSNSGNNNPSISYLKPEPSFFPSLAPYQSVDSSVTNFGAKFSTLSGFPNAAGMPSLTSTSLTPPLASSHFGTFPAPNLPLDFPHSSARFPFNPHASPFLPGLDPPPSAFGPGAASAEFMPEPIPSYLSRHGGAYQPSPSSFQAHADHFHDNCSHTIPSADNTTPRPVMSDSSPSSFYGGPPPQPFHSSSDFFSHTFSSRSDNNAPNNPLGSSESTPILDFSSGFPSPFTLPYPPLPHPGSLFVPYAPAPPFQELPSSGAASGNSKRDEERSDRIVGETGKLMYQHLSPEEWRWKHYEPSFADALDFCGVDTRVRPSGYNHFHGVDSIVYSAVPNSCSSGIVFTEELDSSGGSKSKNADQEENLERFMAQNQPGPSLKLAASALAEMLAAGSNNGASCATSRSMLSQVEAVTSETGVTLDSTSQLGNSRNGGQTRPQRMLEDCCSPLGSHVVHKEGRDASSSLLREFGRLTAEEESYIASLALDSPTRSKPEPSELLPEDVFCDFGGGAGVAWARAKASGKMPEDAICDFGGAGAWALAKASGKMEYSTNPRPVSWVHTVPQSAKGGALNSSGQRRVFSKGSAGIMRQQPSAITGPAKLNHEADAEGNSNLMEAYNLLFSRGPDFTSSRPQSRSSINASSSRVEVEVQPSSDNAFSSGVGPFASTVTATSGLSLFGPHQELPSGPSSSQLPLDSSHNNDQWHVNSTSFGSSPPLSQAHLNRQRSLRPTEVKTEVAYLGTGFHSLAASISNLSKVLFSLDSSALTPPDSAVLEESIQSSILRLSECLVLEQSRINKIPAATRFVGSDEESASRHGRADGSLRDIDDGSTNLGHLKFSDAGILPNVSRSGSPSQLCDFNDLRDTGAIASLKSVDPNALSFDGIFPLTHNDTHSVSTCAMNDVGVRARKDLRHGNTKRPSSSQLKTGPLDDDIIQLLRENDILERSSLERLIDADAREAKLKVLVEELREELELERVENRGTALLCEKIMQETEASKGKAVVQCAQKTDVESLKGKSTGDRSDTSGFFERELRPQHELEDGAHSRAEVKNSEEPFLNKIDEVQSRLALLLSRHALTAQGEISNDGSELGEEMEAVARLNSSEDVVLDNIDQGESKQTPPLAQAAATTGSGSVESRLAVLQARAMATRDSSHAAGKDIDELVVGHHPGQTESTSQGTNNLDGMEPRLALIHGRSGWDNNELGVFTETQPCTPANPAGALDLESGRGSLYGQQSLSGLYEERAAFATKALKAMSHITSQLLIQSETISNMHTAWSQLSEQVNSKSVEKDSDAHLQFAETDLEIPNATAAQAYDGIQDVEARALLIRSRPNWAEGDVSESEAEEFVGGPPVCKIPSPPNSGCARYESDQFETMNEISLVRLLDSDVELSQPLQAKTTAADCPSPRGATGDTGIVELSQLENENSSQAEEDTEDEYGWEHVRFPSRDSE